MICIYSPVEVRITETSLKELLREAEKAKKQGLSEVIIFSPYCDAQAKIYIDDGNQESVGFKLKKGKEEGEEYQ